MKKMSIKRPIAMLLVALMLFGLLPVSVFAANDYQYVVTSGANKDAADGMFSHEDGKVKTQKFAEFAGFDADDGNPMFNITLKVQTTEETTTVQKSKDASVVLVLDVSGSMQSGQKDNSSAKYPDSRIGKAETAIKTFLEGYVKNMGNSKRQVSLVLLGDWGRVSQDWVDLNQGSGVVNQAALDQLLQNLNKAAKKCYNDGYFSTEGTMYSSALDVTKQQLATAKNDSKYVVLVTDGEPTDYVWNIDEVEAKAADIRKQATFSTVALAIDKNRTVRRWSCML